MPAPHVRKLPWKSPDEVAAMTDDQYEQYVRELVREGEQSAETGTYTTDEVLAHLAEKRRGRTRRVGT